LPKALKLMARKGSRAALHHKALEPENISRRRGQIRLGYHTNTIGKPKVQLPTKVAPKKENHQMLETKKCGTMPPRQITLVPWTDCKKMVL
jgi:hypothetical protein